MDPRDIRYLLTDGQQRIQLTARIRHDHRDVAAAHSLQLDFGQRHDVPAFEEQFAGCDAPRFRRQVGALQERLDDLTRLVSDWVWEVASDLTLSYVSARVTERLGQHPRELVGKELSVLGRFVDGAGETAPNPLIVPRPRPFRDVCFLMLHADGSPRSFMLSAVPVFDHDTGRFRGYRGTAHDVSSETRALDLAAKTRDELAEAIESIPDGFALFAPDETLLISNRKFRDMLAAPLADEDDRPLLSGYTARARQLDAVEYELADGRWIRATDPFLDQLFAQRGDGTQDELGAVVDRHDADARRQ